MNIENYMIPSLERYIRAMFDLSKIFTRLEAATNRISGEYLKEIEKKKDGADIKD